MFSCRWIRSFHCPFKLFLVRSVASLWYCHNCFLPHGNVRIFFENIRDMESRQFADRGKHVACLVAICDSVIRRKDIIYRAAIAGSARGVNKMEVSQCRVVPLCRTFPYENGDATLPPSLCSSSLKFTIRRLKNKAPIHAQLRGTCWKNKLVKRSTNEKRLIAGEITTVSSNLRIN